MRSGGFRSSISASSLFRNGWEDCGGQPRQYVVPLHTVTERLHPYSSLQNVSTGGISIFSDGHVHNPYLPDADSMENEASIGVTKSLQNPRLRMMSGLQSNISRRMAGHLIYLVGWSIWFV